MNSKLKFFDFDGTLVFTPGPETLINGVPSLEVYDQHLRENNLPKRAWSGWWGRTETITPPIFGSYSDTGFFRGDQNLLNQELFEIAATHWADPECLNVLATGRHAKMKDPKNPKQHMVKTILDAYGLTFDAYHYCVGGQPTLQFKCGLIEKYLDDYPSIKDIEIWEDREQHYSKFWEMVKWLKKKGRIDGGQVHLVTLPERLKDYSSQEG